MIKKMKSLYLIFSILFSIVEAIGICCFRYQGLYFKDDSSKYSNFVAVIICSFAICMIFLSWIVPILTTESKQSIDRERTIGKFRLRIAFTILLGWIPWLIAFYPGSLFYDMTFQIEQYYGGYTIQMHPPFSTIIMGLCIDLGRIVFGGDNPGVFIYILLQTIVCLVGCTELEVLLYENGISKRDCYVITFFYSLFPWFGSNVQSGSKDVMNYGFMMMTLVFCVRITKEIRNAEISIKNAVGYILFAFFSCLYRKEMIYVYIILTLCLFGYAIIKAPNVRTIILGITMVLVILFSNTMTTEVLSKGVFKQEFYEGEAEGISIPLQQIARCVKYHDDDITEDEKRIIGECFKYGYDQIAGHYNPYLSDPIKYSFSVETADQNGFWDVYRDLFFRKPLVYIESFIMGGYGYYSIVPNVPTTLDGAPTNGLPGGRVPTTYIELSPSDGYNNFYVEFDSRWEKLRNGLIDWLYAFQFSWNLLYSLGFYTWMILLMLILVLMNKGVPYIIPFILSGLMILVCIASPVNDYGRYYMGVIFFFPFLVGYTRLCYSEDK